MYGFFDEVKTVFLSLISQFDFFDAIDLLIVFFVIYKIIGFVRETRAAQLLKGLVIILAMLWLSELLQMNTLNWILSNTMQFGLLALIILFQPELRRALEQVGRSKLGVFSFFGGDDGAHHSREQVEQMADTVGKACDYLSRHRIGALLVFERETKIGEIIKTGTVVDAAISQEMTVSVFFPNSPLHDGAAVVRGNRLHAAGCYLPLTQNNDLNKELGTRHRAAIGLSEICDALVVIVSEETGTISLAENGVIIRGWDAESLKKKLVEVLCPEQEHNRLMDMITGKLKKVAGKMVEAEETSAALEEQAADVQTEDNKTDEP